MLQLPHMRRVEVRRHAPKHAAGHLTEEGKKTAHILRGRLGKYEIIIASHRPRAVQTAELLTGLKPHIDERAGTPLFTPEQERQLHESGETHPYGIAGVILDTPEYRALIQPKGESLAQLIKETLRKLPKDGRALIISHDGVMVTAEMLLKKKSLDRAEKTFKPLKGFVVYEDGTIEDLAT